MTKSKSKIIFSTKWIAYTALLTAFVAATMAIPSVPTVAGKIYWVDGMVLIAAYLMDPVAAFIAGGMGSFIYDALQAPHMMVATLIIHGLQGAVVSALLHYVPPKNLNKWEWIKAIICSLVGAVIVVLGYFSYRCITSGVPTAVASIARNVIQEVIGISIAMVLCYATTFKKQLEKNGLLPDFKRDILEKNDGEEKLPQTAVSEVAITENEINSEEKNVNEN